MKIITIIFLLSLLGYAVNAQTTAVQSVLDNYLQLKDALVKSDAKKALDLASGLQSRLQHLKQGELEPATQQQYVIAEADMIAAVQKIAKKADLEKQRPAFAELSTLLWPIIKASENPGQTIYYDYCPMKKAYWLSTEATIKNPYYGTAMLSCGNIAEQKN